MAGGEESKDKDKHLPIANISRCMKSVVPENGKLTKEAKEAVQDCVSEFICFVTGVAAESCARDKRKTISGNDVLGAMKQLGFSEYVAVLEPYLERFKQSESRKKKGAGSIDEA